MKKTVRKPQLFLQSCGKTVSGLLLVVAGSVAFLTGSATGGITVKRSPEASALYWPVEETPNFTFDPFSFRLHETTKTSRGHAIQEWSFRQSRQMFRPRLLKHRQQLRTDSSETPILAEDYGFGAKIPTRRIIDLSPPADQEVAPSNGNVRIVRRPVSTPFETPERENAQVSENASTNIVGFNNASVFTSGWVPVSESPRVVSVVKSSSISLDSKLNQSQPVRHAQLLARRKWLAANNTFNGTTTQKKKEEYLVSEIEKVEIKKDAIARRNSTNRLLNRLHSKLLLNTTNVVESLEVETVTVQPIPVPTSSSIIIRAGNKTRLRVNRRPALSFTVQNPFSLGVLQVNITPPEPTTHPPNFDLDPSEKIDNTLNLQSVELSQSEARQEKTRDDIVQLKLNVSDGAEGGTELSSIRSVPTSSELELVKTTDLPTVTERDANLNSVRPSFKMTSESPRQSVSKEDHVNPVEISVKTASDFENEDTENLKSRILLRPGVEENIKLVMNVTEVNLTKIISESKSDEKLLTNETDHPKGDIRRDEAIVNTSRADDIFQPVDAAELVETDSIVPERISNNSEITKRDSALESSYVEPQTRQNVQLLNATTAKEYGVDRLESQNYDRGANITATESGTAITEETINILSKQPEGVVAHETSNANKVETVNTTSPKNLEQATQSANDFLFELPKSEVVMMRESKPQRLNRTSQRDDLSRFNEEQRQISRTFSIEDSGESADKHQAGTSVYFVGIIGIIPMAGGAIYLAKLLKQKRRERLHDSDTASVTGFRRGNALLHPLHLGQRKLLKSGKYDGSEIIAQIRISPWEFPRSKLKLVSIIGEGNFGQVWKAEAEEICGFDGRLIVAVKTVKDGAAWREKEELLKEIQLMQQLGPHQNVVSILGCCTDHEPHYLIMEYVMSGRLLTYLRNHRAKKSYYNFTRDPENVSSRDLTSICYNVAKGMEFIASKGIIHRDLAARNVLIDHNKMAKVADFGLSRSVKDTGSEIYEQRSKGALPIRWMAPESLSQSVFTQKSDVWSFGIFTWEVITLGSTPYPGLSAREVMRRVREGLRLERPPHCKPELYKIMTRSWATDPARRPDFSELKCELAKALDNSNDYVDFDKFHESAYCHMTPIKEGEEKL